MKKGDLVFSVLFTKWKPKWGIILERVHDPLAVSNKVFKVWWGDGTVGNNVWDYDLTSSDGMSS
jgi:hypothetical protein